MAKRELEWGETPWDDMSREDLLREMQRAYAAVNAARSVMAIVQGPEPSPFWTRGSGHRALAMCEAVVRRVEDRFDSENVYRAFFRYAVDLLFAPALGFGWRICTEGHMTGDESRRRSPVCVLDKCVAPARDIEWRDIERKDRPAKALPQSNEDKEKDR